MSKLNERTCMVFDRDSEALAVLVLSKMLLFLGLRHLLILLISSYKLRLAQLRLSEHSLLAHAYCWRALVVGLRSLLARAGC